MRYRVVSTEEGFYPQEKRWWWFWQRLLDEQSGHFVGRVDSFDDAVQLIERNKRWRNRHRFRRVKEIK